jgi:ParB-like chromosome segregation protein Spo0J
VRDVDDPLEVALLENLQREDPAPLERGRGHRDAHRAHGYTHQVAAELLGKSRPYVSNTLCLTRLPDQVKTELRREGKGHLARAPMGIAREDDPEMAVQLWQRLKLQLSRCGASARPAARRGGAPGHPRGAPRHPPPRPRLGRLGAEEISSEDRQRLVRALRRTERVVQRRLALLEVSKLL